MNRPELENWRGIEAHRDCEIVRHPEYRAFTTGRSGPRSQFPGPSRNAISRDINRPLIGIPFSNPAVTLVAQK
jgi:hypothetical protein